MWPARAGQRNFSKKWWPGPINKFLKLAVKLRLTSPDLHQQASRQDKTNLIKLRTVLTLVEVSSSIPFHGRKVKDFKDSAILNY